LESLQPEKDWYLLGADFPSYLAAMQRVEKAYRDKNTWAKMSILSTAGMGMFSSDRSVKEYP
jgi:starch phosphorylase